MKSKKLKFAIICAAAYTVLVFAMVSGIFGRPEPDAEPAPESVKIDNRDFYLVPNDLEYARYGQEGLYAVSDEITLKNTDTASIFDFYNLPALERMDEEDALEKTADLQVFQKMRVLGVEDYTIYTPEYNWKAVYNESITAVMPVLENSVRADFSGGTASELNAFLEEHAGECVEIRSESILLDETILIPSDTILNGNRVRITGKKKLPFGILIEDARNVAVNEVSLLGGYEQGIYIVNSSYVMLWRNEITEADFRAVCVMGDNTYIHLVNNNVYENGQGGIVLNGDISRCILQGNCIYQNHGARNLKAGIALSAVMIDDIYVPYNYETFKDEYLYDMVDGPHDNVIKDNLVQGNYSSGIYCDGGYLNYFIDNTIADNEKEGMCLDFGSFGNYIRGNHVRGNGDRNRQSDADLEADFILGLGRLPDGSSTAKLPGISLDNAAYNIIFDNSVTYNSGTGIKMVRSGYRNLILSNSVINNNQGKNEAFHGFGIEMGYASEPDETVKGLDFTPDYENIIAKNVISGGHYAGIYIGTDGYCNDLIENVLTGCELFSIENHSQYFNSAVGNVLDIPTLDFVQNR